jgi:hypothetical protein
MNITEAEFDALEYVAAVGRVATHDGPHISSLLERLRPFAKRETDSPQAVASTPQTNATPGEGSVPQAYVKGDEKRVVCDTKQEPVAWAVVYPTGDAGVLCFFRRDAVERATASDRVVPLYRSPTLTDEEREAVEWFAEVRKPLTRLTQSHNCEKYKDTLRGLLERRGGER